MLTKFSEGFNYIDIRKKKIYYVHIYNTFITIDSLGDTNKKVNPINNVKALLESLYINPVMSSL